MVLINAPEYWNSESHGFGFSIFLAGSIEMGAAENWQNKVIKELSDTDVIVFNPRRPDWDSSWVQSIDNPDFYKQVNWELDHIEAASIIMFYFDPNTMSPITLMELGVVAQDISKEIFVCCNEPFWRKGNVDIICKRNNIKMYASLNDMIKAVKESLNEN